MKCSVYKGRRKADHYLYVSQDAGLERVPDALLALLGALEFVMDIDLTVNRKLARANVVSVLRALRERGYYLQLPPSAERP